MARLSNQTTYIYGLFDPCTRELRYVGKTVKPVRMRTYAHISRARHGEKTHRSAWIRKLLSGGLVPEFDVIEIVLPGCDWEGAESFWIAYYRAIGANLTNQTAGGEGTVGYSPTTETRIKLGNSTRGKPKTAEHRAKIARAHTGMKRSDEVRAKISAARRNMSDDTRLKLRLASLGKTHSEEARKKLSIAGKGRTHSEEVRKKISKAKAGIGKSLEHRAKLSEFRRAMPPASGYKGVSFKVRAGMWYAAISVCVGMPKYLGRFHTPEEAAKAYDDAAYAAFGCKCYLNFPERFISAA